MTRYAAVVLIVACGLTASAADPDPRSLAVPPVLAGQAFSLVAQLSDRDFAARDSATKGLRGLGRLAVPALRLALATDPNPEVRLRVELLMPAAAAADLRARADCFLADAAGRFEHDLPGLNAFVAAAGRTPAARTLFGDILRSGNRDLIAAVDGPDVELRERYVARRAELRIPAVGWDPRRPDVSRHLSGVDLATLLLVESRLGQGVDAAPLTPLLAHPGGQSSLRTAMAGDPRKEVLGALLTHWADTRDTPQSTCAALGQLAALHLPNGLAAARTQLRKKAAVAAGEIALCRAVSCAYVGRFGTPDDQPLLEGLFADDGVAANLVGAQINAKLNVKRGTVIQTRDVALATCLLRTRQHPADYGFTSRLGGPATADITKYSVSAFAFEADTDEMVEAKRDAAFKKYAEWKASLPAGQK